MSPPLERSVVGCLLGTAVGDAIGLPFEGISRSRQKKMFPDITGHHFLMGKGMVSDDTEHICMVAQALAESGGDGKIFAKNLARRLRRWLLGLPAGVGSATLRATLKLWMGFPADRSGVFSAGNGPAMRSAIIGICCGDDREKLKNLVKISTRITHTDPKAEYGALAVALAADFARRGQDDPNEYYKTLEDLVGSDAREFLELVKKALESHFDGTSTETFASQLGQGQGVTGYMYHTLPVALHAWFRHPRDYRSAVMAAVRCGGDTDTVAAILGGIIGAGVGKQGIPPPWLKNLIEWPMTTQWIERLGGVLAASVREGRSRVPPEISFLSSLMRNLFFMCCVLFHGFRRILRF